MKFFAAIAIAAALTFGLPVKSLDAGKPSVVSTRIIMIGEPSYSFYVTVAYEDISWKQYANRWEVIGPTRKFTATRILPHPHICQPHFIQSLYPVIIPASVTYVIGRVHDSIHDYSWGRLMALPTAGKRDTG